jgi:very-short-patch-repair endonuclease
VGNEKKEIQTKASKYYRRLRENPTKHESILLNKLAETDIQFKFQAYFFDSEKLFFPDFLIYSRWGDKPGQVCKVVIEIDGRSHLYQKEYDTRRDEWLRKNRACRIVRFTNEQIESDIDSVMKAIMNMRPRTKGELLAEKYLSNFND